MFTILTYWYCYYTDGFWLVIRLEMRITIRYSFLLLVDESKCMLKNCILAIQRLALKIIFHENCKSKTATTFFNVSEIALWKYFSILASKFWQVFLRIKTKNVLEDALKSFKYFYLFIGTIPLESFHKWRHANFTQKLTSPLCDNKMTGLPPILYLVTQKWVPPPS